MTTEAEVLPFPYGSRPLRSVASILTDILENGTTPFCKLVSTMELAGWRHSKPIPTNRLVNRLAINRLGNSHFGIKTRAGYSRVFHYAKKQHGIGVFPLSETLKPWTSDGLSKHQNLGLVHPELPNCFVSMVGPNPDAEQQRNGCVYSVVFFGHHSSTERTKSIIDLQSVAKYFDGTSKIFFTPSGNRKDIGHTWTYDMFPMEFEGRREDRQIMGLSRNLYFSKCRFLTDLLPGLQLPQSCSIHTVMRSIW